jgi:hypothetical protein
MIGLHELNATVAACSGVAHPNLDRPTKTQKAYLGELLNLL